LSGSKPLFRGPPPRISCSRTLRADNPPQVSAARVFQHLPTSPFPRLVPARPVEVLPPGLLRTARMVLRPLRESDRAEFIRTIQSSADHLRACSGLFIPGEAPDLMFSRQLSLCSAGDEHGTAWRRIGMLESGRIVGSFNLNSISRGLELEADANWWIAKEFCGQGFGQEGVQAMLDHALADLPMGLGLHRVSAAIMPSNLASVNLAQKVGFLRQPSARVSIRLGERWEFHEVYARSVAA
jgi:ribosomal-protein-alanine N-acetyltransferase